MNYPVEVDKLQAKGTPVSVNDVQKNRMTKEEIMSTKFIFKVVLALGLLAAIFLAVQNLIRTPALSPSAGKAMSLRSAIGSDWIERHPQAAVRANVYAGSDYFERHSAAINNADIYVGSDYFERHRLATSNAAIYIGSDWIERHPPIVARIEAYALSDYFERHPVAVLNTARYAGSDYAERHLSNRYAGSDFGERHPDLVNP